MVRGQLQVDSAHEQENNLGNTQRSVTTLKRLFTLFTSKPGNLQKVCGHDSKTFNHKIFYSDKYLVSYDQAVGIQVRCHHFCPILTKVLCANNISHFSSCYILCRHGEATRFIFAAFI